MSKTKDIKILVKRKELFEIRSKYKPALFLDRDGVIIKEMNHIKDPNLVRLESGVKDLISKTLSSDWLIIIITNQSGIGRGLFSWNEYEEVTKQMLYLLGEKNYPTAIYANSQIEQKINNCWRKPSPNMLFQAAEDLNINLKKSILIGDRLSDLKAGINAGLSKTFHLTTGHGRKERAEVLDYFSEHMQKGQFSDLTINLCINTLNDLPNDLFESYL